MSSRQYLSSDKGSFFSVEEDDVDDETFLRNSRVSSNLYQERDRLENKRQELLDRRKEIEERTLESSNRSIGLLRDSEQIGVATAEELLRQREQLEKTEKRLDEINTTLRFSQKHIQGIKSVFGSLKNYISGKSGGQQPTTPNKLPEEFDRTSSPLYNTVAASKLSPDVSPNDSHPGLRVRGLQQDSSCSNDASNFQSALNRNLEEMCGSLSKLKGLAQGLGEEIDSQNDLLDRITDKTERADVTIGAQNKDMQRLLGGKKK